MNDPSQTLPTLVIDAVVPARFHQVVHSVPNHPAIIDGEQRISYAELDAWSDRVAGSVIGKAGLTPQPVALSFGHGAEVIAALLGVLKAGHFYTVIDPAIPESRARVILDNLQSGHILTTAATSHARRFSGMDILTWEESVQQTPTMHGLPLPTADALGAICYTSGTTDQPKGVMWDHAMISHCAWQMAQVYPIGPQDVTALLYMAAYPASVTDLFGTLLNGGALAIYRLAQQGVTGLRDWLTDNRVTMLHLHTTVLRQLLDTLPAGYRFDHLRYVRPSGRTPVADIRRLQAHLHPDAVIVHSLTSSETCPITRLVIQPETELTGEITPVGFPINTAQITLLGEDGRPVQPGEVGEIVVCSRYLARGYWRQPELTAQRFQTDPDDPSVRIYRMGDLARWRPDGMLEWLGRNDRRVKIRGYTVDLDAAERTISRLPQVREATVTTLNTLHDTKLVAYLCLSDAAGAVTTSALRAALARELPGYMLPARVVVLDELPRQNNGKVNYDELPAPGRARPDLAAPFAAPRNETEQQIADIWADLLELDEVGVQDDFFELGGDSIAAMSMLFKVEQGIGCTISRNFLRNPTIANIARLSMGESEILAYPVQADSVNTEPVLHQPTPRRLRSQLRRLAERLESRILEHALNMPYQEGMAWLRHWAGQPLVQRIRYFRERRLYREFAASFDSPLSHDRHAFAEAILNNIWGTHIRQMARGRPAAEYTAALQGSRWRFWRDFGNQLAASLVDPTAPTPYDIVGKEILYDVVRQGRGVILAGPHLPVLGAYKVILAGLGMFPYAITGAAFDRAHAELTAAEHISAGAPHRQVQHTHELLRAWELLRQGKVIYIPIDAAAGVGPRIYTPVGQRLFPFNVGAIELALATGAPLLPMTTLLQPDNRLRLTIAAPLSTGDLRMEHDERLWITAQACGKFLGSLWRDAPFARTWGDMAHFLGVTRSPAEMSPGQWIDFDEGEGRHA